MTRYTSRVTRLLEGPCGCSSLMSVGQAVRHRPAVARRDRVTSAERGCVTRERGRAMARATIRRMGAGPALVVEDAERLALDVMRMDAGSQPGGYEDLAGHGERDRITA